MSVRIALGLLLVAYAVALAAGAIPAVEPRDVSDLLEARSPRALAETAWRLLEGGLLGGARFLPLGLLAALALGSRKGLLARLVHTWLPALAIASALGLIALRVAGGAWSRPYELVFPAAGVFVGVWLGAAMARGWRGLVGFAATATLAILALAAGGVSVMGAALDTSPKTIEQPQVTSVEKRRIYALFKGLHPHTIPAGQTRTLRLFDRDLNLLLSWGLSLGTSGRQARIQISPDESTLEASARLPGGRFLNAELAGGVSVEDGRLLLDARRLRLGRLEVPAAVLRAASPWAAEALASDRRVKPLAAAIRAVDVAPHEVRLTFGHGELPPGFVADLFHGRDSREELPLVQAHVQHLLARPRVDETDARFLSAVQSAFAFAAERARDGSAVAENRAAILALGMLLGHPRVETLTGSVMSSEERRQARQAYAGATLRQRPDWPQHFFVSAALTVLAVESVSDATGLLKEELDAGGGSGFSFADLLADRSGTTLAAVATRDEGRARALQARLGAATLADDIFPPADGLPEGIQDAELRSRYGGVGGAEYRRLAEEVERRVAACPAYR